jgi:hypothetical protein
MEEVGPEEAMPAVGVVARTAAFSKELDQPLELLALAVVAAELAAAAPPLARRSTSHYPYVVDAGGAGGHGKGSGGGAVEGHNET